MSRRSLILCSCSAALLGCGRLKALLTGDPSADERFLSEDELAREPFQPAAGSFEGALEARRFMSYAGCADQGATLRWLVLEHRGLRLPLRIVTESTLAALRAGDEGALENDELQADPLSPDDAARLGLRVGQNVRLEGACAALHFSGTLTLDPIFGLCTTRIARA